MLFLNALPAFVALQALQFIPTALAEFRVTCSPFKRERIDPIATPGKENGHMHTFFGNRGIGPEMPSYEQLVSGCGSCGIAGDKSAYWIPTLYYVTKNATVPVKVAIFHIYYNGQNPNREPFPEDYNIISHDPTLSEEEVKAQGGNGMKWYFEDSDEQKENWQLPKQKGGGWLRGNVPFPTSVIKDESLGRYRACTANDTGCFNVLRMFFAIWYDLRHEFFDFQDGAYLTLSSGGGHTYHGDFIYGWERSFASMIVQDDTDYVNANGILPVGGEKSTIKSTECQKQDEEGFTLGKPDWDAMLEANAGNGTVELGHYGKSLTITNGKSMNATFSGKWGDVGKVDAEAFSEAPAASMNEFKSAGQPAASIYTLPSVAASSASTSHTASVELPAATASAITTRKASPSACSRNKKIHGRRH